MTVSNTSFALSFTTGILNSVCQPTSKQAGCFAFSGLMSSSLTAAASPTGVGLSNMVYYGNRETLSSSLFKYLTPFPASGLSHSKQQK
jgi:hypothetical protein